MDKTNSPPGSSPPLSPLNLKLSKYLRNRCPARAGMDPSCLRGSYHHWVANPLTPPYQRAAGLITLLTTPSPSHIIRLLNPPPSHPLPPYQQDDASASCPSGSTNHHGWNRADQVFGEKYLCCSKQGDSWRRLEHREEQIMDIRGRRVIELD